MKVASWNIEGRLSRFSRAGKRGSPEQILANIERLDSDIVFLPEAFDGARPIEPEIMRRLEKELGYAAFTVQYGDSGSREFAAVVDPHMMFLSRLKIEHTEERRLGAIRNSLVIDVFDTASSQIVRLCGVHLDDRQEGNRLRQVEDLIPIVLDSPYPLVLMGDFNAMYADSWPARVLRNPMTRASISMLSRMQAQQIRYMSDIAIRLSGMASGKTLRRIENETNLVPASAKRHFTTTPKMRGQEWMPSVCLAQIDHMFVSPGLETAGFRVAPDGGSDHRAISTTLTAS